MRKHQILPLKSGLKKTQRSVLLILTAAGILLSYGGNTINRHIAESANTFRNFSEQNALLNANDKELHSAELTAALCSDEVPWYIVDFRNNPDSNWISPSVEREGTCCGQAGECISMTLMLPVNAVAIQFDILSGPVQSGDTRFQLGCGEYVKAGRVHCVPGGFTYQLTFCDPGSEANVFGIRCFSKLPFDDRNGDCIPDADINPENAGVAKDREVHNKEDFNPPTGTAPPGYNNISTCLSAAQSAVPFDPVEAASGYSTSCPGGVTAQLAFATQIGDDCSWVLTYTFDVIDACGHVLANQTITHLGGDSSPPVINCPPDITLNSPDDLDEPAATLVTYCDGSTGTISPFFGDFYEQIYGLLDEPGFCPDSVYRYYIAKSDCGVLDTCLQRIVILPQDTCKLCQDDVNYLPVDLTDYLNATLFAVERNGMCCGYSWPDGCTGFDVRVPAKATGLGILTTLGGPNPPRPLELQELGQWSKGCTEDAMWAGNILLLGSDDTVFTLLHCKPGGNRLHYVFELITDSIPVRSDVFTLGMPANAESGTVLSSPLNNTSGDLLIYPNPAEERILLDLPVSGHDTYSISILDQVGSVVANWKINDNRNSIELEIADVTAGVYFVVVNGNHDGPPKVGKLIKL